MMTLDSHLEVKSLREDLAILRKDLKRVMAQRDGWRGKYKAIVKKVVA